MLTQIYRPLATFLLIIPFFYLLGCDSDNDPQIEPDIEPPAIPRGVRSITGNDQVTIEWFPNGETDLAGYKIWRGEDDINFNLLEEVPSDTSRFVDSDVTNGITYYYAVSALDFDDNESGLSPEEIPDTPRPSGNNVTLDNSALFAERSGFDFSQPARGAIPWDSPTTDVYFGVGTASSDQFVYEGVYYLYSDNSTIVQDMGYHEIFDEVDVSPDQGFVPEFVELVDGHVYVLFTPDGNFAKIHVKAVSENSVTFDWAYQIDPDNPELAPPLNESVNRHGAQ